MNLLNRRLLLLAVVLGTLIGPGQVTARAGYVYHLTLANFDQTTYPGEYGTVEVTRNSATSATLVFTAVNNGGWTYKFGDGGTVGFNVNGSITAITAANITGTNGGWSFNKYDPNSNLDGFGKFSATIDGNGGSSNATTTMTVNITGVGTNWANDLDVLTPNSGGYSVGGHVFIYDSNGAVQNSVLTGFAVDGSVSTVPVPASFLLASSGLLVLGFVRVRRMVRREPSAA